MLDVTFLHLTMGYREMRTKKGGESRRQQVELLPAGFAASRLLSANIAAIGAWHRELRSVCVHLSHRREVLSTKLDPGSFPGYPQSHDLGAINPCRRSSLHASCDHRRKLEAPEQAIHIST